MVLNDTNSICSTAEKETHWGKTQIKYDRTKAMQNNKDKTWFMACDASAVDLFKMFLKCCIYGKKKLK